MNRNKKKFLKVLMFLSFSMFLMDKSYSVKSFEKETEEKQTSHKRGRSHRPTKKPIPDYPIVRDPLAGKLLKYDSRSNMYYYGEIIEEVGEEKSADTAKLVRDDSTGLVVNLKVVEDKNARAPVHKKPKNKGNPIS